MGQAKNRGTFEQRKAEGEARLQREALERRIAAAEREAALTPAERRRRDSFLATLRGLHAIASSEPALQFFGYDKRIEKLLRDA